MESKVEPLARLWIKCWSTGKVDDIALAEDFTHTSSFGTVQGREKYLAWVKPLAAKNVVELNIINTFGKENEAVICFERQTPNGPVLCCDWVESDGMNITAIASL